MWMVLKVKEMNYYAESEEVICTASNEHYAEFVARALEKDNDSEMMSYIAMDMNKLPEFDTLYKGSGAY